MDKSEWAENVILADADYVDGVAFNLIVNFERMLGRRIPQADMAQWVECVALDGGMPMAETAATGAEGQPTLQVVLVHRHGSNALQNFAPSDYADELNGKAVQTRVGECLFTVVQTEDMAPKGQLMSDLLDAVCQQPSVRRLMVVPDEQTVAQLRPVLQHHDSEQRRTTLLTMQPMAGNAWRHVLLGFSLMAALGISSKEIDEKLRE